MVRAGLRPTHGAIQGCPGASPDEARTIDAEAGAMARPRILAT